jgi:hypothetical protein
MTQAPTEDKEKSLHKPKDATDSGSHAHAHNRPSGQATEPKSDQKWSSLLQLQSVVITKPKKAKQRRSTFSFFGNANRVLPIDTTLLDQHSHPIADAVIESSQEGLLMEKKRNKKRRSSV